ncbi:MAG TPA: MFS transporter [Ktedonobacteraceae bacterium]
MSHPLKQNTARLAMLVACVAVFLTALDQTVVVTALPQIIQDLQITPLQLDHAAWIVSGYLLGYVIVMPLMGRISDIYGRRWVFVICLSIFALGSLFCALSPMLGDNYDISFLQNIGIDVSSPGLVWLVAARFIQAAGGGAVVPVAMAISGDFYSYKQRAFVLGLVGMVTETGGVLGPLYGALIVQYLGWQYIFYLNLPIIGILLFFIIRFIPTSSIMAESDRSNKRIDMLGALLLGASLVCLSLGLAQEAAQITPTTLRAQQSLSQNNPWLIVAALILLVAFIALEIYMERRGHGPIITLSLFKRAQFSATSMMSFLVGTALIIAMVNIPFFFLTVFNQSSTASGLALLRLTALIPIGALIGGRLCSRFTCRWTAVLGLLPTVLGFWLMHNWTMQIDWTQITISTMLTGFGLGLVIAPISTTAINAASKHQLGMASSVVTVLRMIGMICGLAALTSWGLGRFRAQMTAFKLPPSATTPGTEVAAYAHYIISTAHDIYASIFLVGGILCLIALLPALFLEGSKNSSTFVHTTNGNDGVDSDHPQEVDSYSQQKNEASTIHEQRKK